MGKETNEKFGKEIKMTLTKLCEETRRIMITKLIGLGEVKREIYEQLRNDTESQNEEFIKIYELHCNQQELLIKYQNERNGNN